MNNIPVEKNKEYIVDIIDNGYEGEGIAKINNFTIFIPGAIKGEQIKILIVKVNSSHAFGKIIEIIEKSSIRTDSDCNTYKRCGGCNLRHMNYKETLKLKQTVVQNLASKMLKTSIEVKETIGMEKPYNYRNKAQFPVGYNKDNEIITGVYANRSHDIIETKECFIQNKELVEIAKYIIELMKKYKITAYNEKDRTGIVRHIVTKIGVKTNEVMCIIVVNEEKLPHEKEIISEIINKFSNIKTIVKNVNSKNTNVILGNKNINLYGDGYIYDKLGEYTFEISALSFYQINPIQTEKLYNKAIELANLDGKDIVLDLYCGIGTIGIFTSKLVKKVIGVEIVEQAIDNAKKNANINKIGNMEFLCGDVENVLEKLVNVDKIKPTVIFVDPPRKGLDTKTIENIMKVKSSKVVYISCNPATLMRDLSELEESYNIEIIQPVDMFPFTSHVECCSVLYLKDMMK